MIVEVDPALVEKTVLCAVAEQDAPTFDRERERLYDVAGREARDRAFAELFGRWFQRLGAEQPIRDALAEVHGIGSSVTRALVVGVARVRDEGAELYGPGRGGERSGPAPIAAARPSLVIRMRPETLADAESTLLLLRRELLHVADMLDPTFGYSPDLPALPGGPAEERLVRARYGAAWKTTVLGRLVRTGRASATLREPAREELAAAFPRLEGGAEVLFARLFEEARPSHAELVELAISPRQDRGARRDRVPGTPCPLCRMPTHVFVDVESPAAAALIGADEPNWQPKMGACPQCAEIYRTRAGS